ncbi:MarR family winged helix-turn-helix transcriptional regulator [Anaerotignum sp. MB30-C6]|uniref:MarR family winged helix-turn-helix transcriptional regulator n=1 Tax=Anaerotignum sp. MB30-C6 TaxID=3070814 RepID=UPI0027DACECB|nr:MarR family transcriptional regulator [Anaerotignum sp. MB30-C6]WMI79857.1 MarR family transcriptional regulator [Anaerotignum sp. MB30-C6]
MNFSERLAKKREAMGKHTTDFSFTMNALLRLYHIYMMRSAQEIGLSAGQPPILMSLTAKNLQTQKELCEFIRIKPGSMTDVLKRMERDELVERIRDENDMRSMRVSITEKGKNKFREFIEKGATIDEVGFRGFSKEEKDVCLGMLARILENVNKDLQEMGEQD